MKTKEEIKKWLLENCIDEYGNLDLSGLDFSDFEGSVYIGDMKVKDSLFQNRQTVGKDLFQNSQTVGEDLYQDSQTVGNNLFQNWQEVGGSLYQSSQQVGGDLYQSRQEVGNNLFQDRQKVGRDLFSHKLEENEEWKDDETCVKRIKKLKPITKKELEEMGYELV